MASSLVGDPTSVSFTTLLIHTPSYPRTLVVLFGYSVTFGSELSQIEPLRSDFCVANNDGHIY